jgi:hypothetical protein
MCANVQAEYTPPPLFDMIGCSDLVAMGKIQSLNRRTYTLRIEKVLVGDTEKDVIEIVRFRDWVCSWRWAQYEVGQQIVVFADRDKRVSGELGRTIYSLRSGGCESEFPIEDDLVFCYSIYSRDRSKYHTIGKHKDVFRCKLDNLVSAIESYQALYKFRTGEAEYRIVDGRLYFLKVTEIERRDVREKSSFRPRRGPSTIHEGLIAYSSRSSLHRFLVNSTESMAVKLGTDDLGWQGERGDDGFDVKVRHFAPVDE